MNRNVEKIAVALCCLALTGFMTLSAATATFTIADDYDDCFVWDATGEEYTNEYVWCGTYTGYEPPYLMGVFRFANVTIPQGVTVSGAYLRVQAYTAGSGASEFTIQGENYDSVEPLNEGALWLFERSLTDAAVTWSVPSAWSEDSVYNSPDLKTVVQEIVDRPGWASGHALAIHLKNAISSGGWQAIFSKEGAAEWGGSSAELIVTYESDEADGVKSENYISGATNSPSQFPLYLNSPSMYYPAASGGICWASAAADILAYWDRAAYNGITYWNLIDNGVAPLRQLSLPTAPGHGEANVKAAIAWLSSQYYGLGRTDEDIIIEEFANQTNGLAFNSTYHPPVGTISEKTNYLNTIKAEINAGRPISIGSFGTYFGGAHQIPVLGYREMTNAVNSMVYIHRNTGGTQSEYVNFFDSLWSDMDMDQIVPGGTPVDQYEAVGDNTALTTVEIVPSDVYNFRQTHNFSVPGDVDWIRLSAVSGRGYTITTTNLGASCDTVLGLYQGDGTTQILSDDDGGTQAKSSKVVWRCWSTGTCLLRLNDKSGGSGSAANYDVQVSAAVITNEAPTNLTLSSSLITENQSSGTVVGTLGSTDSDPDNTFTYSLVSGSGSDDNGSFTVSGAQLKSAAAFDFETKSSYAVRLRTADQGGLSYEKAFTVTVQDVNEAPTNLFLSASLIAENQPSGTTVGTLGSTDPDSGNTFTYSLVSGSGSDDNGSFTVSGAQLKSAAAFDFETKSSYAVRLRTADQGGLSYEKAFTVTVQDVAESTSSGTPYVWLDQYGLVSGGDYEAAASADSDGDGLAAWQEYVAGTVPTNGASVFYAVLLQTSSVMSVHWLPDLTDAVPTRVYSVYGTDSLLDGFPGEPFTNVPAGSSLTLPVSSSNRFFKVGVGFR